MENALNASQFLIVLEEKFVLLVVLAFLAQIRANALSTRFYFAILQ